MADRLTTQTKVSDVVVPEIFLPYVIERTAQLSEFVTSGIVERSPEFDMRATSGGGDIIQMPFWRDLDGDDEVLTDDKRVDVNKIQSGKDQARLHNRIKAFGAHDLAGILSGDDPMMAIAELASAYRARRLQAQIIATLQGIFNSSSMASNLLDIHKASGTPDSSNFLTGVTWIAATQKLGDARAKLTAVIMHSMVESSLRAQNLIEFLRQSEGMPDIPTFQGKRVIMDDGCPMETIDGKPVYTTYLFGQGAIAWGESADDHVPEGAAPGSTWKLEFDRDARASSSAMIMRWRNILHPRGVRWTETSVADQHPTNAEIALGVNWQQVYEPKNVRIVAVKHNIPTIAS